KKTRVRQIRGVKVSSLCIKGKTKVGKRAPYPTLFWKGSLIVL
ncbi:hypothetical protein Goari_010172, partial [Gossypium aridum]|nr:hypothetical protein [Gossypium aridum]